MRLWLAPSCWLGLNEREGFEKLAPLNDAETARGKCIVVVFNLSKMIRAPDGASGLHFGFVVSKLVSGGREFGCNFKLIRFANCLFCVVLLCVKHTRAG